MNVEKVPQNVHLLFSFKSRAPFSFSNLLDPALVNLVKTNFDFLTPVSQLSTVCYIHSTTTTRITLFQDRFIRSKVTSVKRLTLLKSGFLRYKTFVVRMWRARPLLQIAISIKGV